jgi:hypothetical protein
VIRGGALRNSEFRFVELNASALSAAAEDTRSKPSGFPRGLGGVSTRGAGILLEIPRTSGPEVLSLLALLVPKYQSTHTDT